MQTPQSAEGRWEYRPAPADEAQQQKKLLPKVAAPARQTTGASVAAVARNYAFAPRNPQADPNTNVLTGVTMTMAIWVA